jgi:hypothetical protein
MSGCCGGKAAVRYMTPEEADEFLYPLERQGEGATATDRFEAEAYVIPSEASYAATEHVWLEVPDTTPTSAELIKAEYTYLCDLALAKNEAYGDSALHPVRIFSKADALAAIDARIDDKLSRVKHAPEAFGEDVEADLIGYLVLRRIARRLGK